MSTLFQIGDDLEALDRLLDDLEGDISNPDVDAAVTAWFAELDANLATKTDGYVNLIKRWEGEKAAAQAAADQYLQAVKVRDNRIKSLKERLKLWMEANKRPKITTASARTISVCGNGGLAPLILTEDVIVDKLPPEFQRHIVEPDAGAIRKHLEAGNKLAFASLLPRGTHLRIK